MGNVTTVGPEADAWALATLAQGSRAGDLTAGAAAKLVPRHVLRLLQLPAGRAVLQLDVAHDGLPDKWSLHALGGDGAPQMEYAMKWHMA